MRRYTRIIALNLIIFLFAATLADLALWWIAPLEHAAKVNVSQEIEGLESEFEYSTIGYGLRSEFERSIAPPADSNVVRVLCVGASTTDQPTQDVSATWCATAAKEARRNIANGSPRIQAFSFGRGGDRALNTAHWLAEMLDRLNPDIVITLLGVNDLAWNGGPEYVPLGEEATFQGLNSAVETRLILRHARYFLLQNSQIFRYLNRVRYRITNSKNLQSGRVVEWHSSNLPRLQEAYRDLPAVLIQDRSPDPVDEFRSSLRWILQYLESKNITTIVLGQPVLWKPQFTPDEYESLWFSINTPQGPVRPDGAWLASEMSRYNAVQKSEAAKYDALFINLDSLVPKSRDYYFDDCHFTDKGSILVGAIVGQAITQALRDVYSTK